MPLIPLVLYVLLALFYLFFIFWLISMIISSLTQAPYVVSASKAIDDALALAKPQPGEKIFDLGCGDARVLIKATKKYNTLGFGYDISPFCVLKARLIIRFLGLNDKIKIFRVRLQKAKIEEADVIFLYLTNRILDQFETEIFKRIKPTCRVVNLAFPFKNHKPKQTIPARQLGRNTNIYLYTKP